MKTIFFLLLTLLMIAAPTTAGETLVSENTEGHQKFDPARDAKKDLHEAIDLGIKSNKRILLDIGGEWCIWCHRLDSLFIQNTDLADFLEKHYVVVKINVSKENKNEKILSKYPKVPGYPHFFVLDKNGKLLVSQDTGELENPKGAPVKGHDKKKVFAFLKKWAGK